MLSSSLRRVGVKGADSPLSYVRCAATAAARHKTATQDSDAKRIKATGKRLIQGVKQARNNPEWKHTYGKSGESKRLKQDVLAKRSSQLQVDPTDVLAVRPVESWSVEEFLQSGSNVLRPGTFFEFRRNAEIMHGVVLSTLANKIGYNEDMLSITTLGEVVPHRATDVMFAVPNFVDSYLVERCGKAEKHEDEHQLMARLRVVRAAREFERAVEKEQYRLGRVIRDVYPQVRARNPDEWGKVTTMQVARMLDAAPNVPLATLFAVHRQLMDRADEFVCHPSRHRFVHTFDVRPLSHLKNIEIVKQMVRERNPVIHYFQEKAKVLIDRSRELAANSQGQPPSVAEISDMKFTPREQEIIAFLRLGISSGRRIQQDAYEGNIPALIKDTNRYDELITSHVALKFLREIGVFTPWEDMATKDKDLHIPPATEAPHVPTVTASTPTSVEQESPTKTPGLLTTDPHESVRHDFGDMPVYVIDDAQAEELDDGVSIETIPDEPDSAWIHVHVADPTTIVPVTHPLAQEITKRTETYYFGHKSLPMLPDDISAISDMGRSDVNSAGQNVLTFSAKIGRNAELLDYKVRAGVVRNIHRLRYDDVNGILSPGSDAVRFTPFEPELSELDSVDTSYILPHAESLKNLFEVTRRLVKERLDQDIFIFAFNSPDIAFLDKPVLENPSRVTHPILYRGYPRLRYYVHRGDVTEIGSRSLVAESMKLASRVASRFCLDHNIPAIRRGMGPVELEESRLSRLLASRNEQGFVDVGVLSQVGIVFPAGELTTKPVGHWLLGVREGEGYVRTTSPLRRSEDMIMHWQIKSALLPNGGAPPPIDEDRLKGMLEDMNGRKHALKRAYRKYTRQWALTYIQRFMDEQEKAGTQMADTNPLRGMDGVVIQLPVYNLVRWSNYQDVYIPKLGLTAVLPVAAGTSVPIGSRVKVNAKTLFQYDVNQTLEVELA